MPTPLFKNLSLDRLSEVFGYIKSELDKKVTVVNGKGLSTNDYTTTEKNKLSGIASGAEVNVQSDWSESNTSSDAYILNKPSSMPASDVYSWAKASTKPSYTFSEIGSKPTTIAGYGITDAKIANGTITLGSNTITPLTSHQTVSNKGATLAWSTAVTVATIGSTDIKVSLPSNPNTNTTYTIATGDSNGQIKVTPSSGSAYNVSVKGLGSNAYTSTTIPTKTSQLTNDSDFISGTVAESATASTIVKRNSSGYIYATYYNQSSSVEVPTTSSNWVFVNSDGWFRKSSLDNLRSLFGEYTAYIPESSSPAAGWRRICKINGGKAGYANGFLAISGGWNNGAPGSAIIAITAVHTGATMTLLSNNRTDTMIQQVRLVNISGNQFWVDAYMHAQSGGVSTQYFRFSGNFTITDIQKSSTVITDSVTPTATVSLTNGVVSGTVITSNSIGSQSVNYATSAGSATSATSATTASKLGSSNVGSATQPIYLSSGTATACTYTLGKSVPSGAVFTDTKVTQTATTTDANYEILFSGTADNTTRTETARKSYQLTFNPNSGHLNVDSTISLGSAGASVSYLYFYEINSSYYSRIYLGTGTALTANRSVYLPNASGTIALTSDIPTLTTVLTGGAVGATKAVTNLSTFKLVLFECMFSGSVVTTEIVPGSLLQAGKYVSLYADATTYFLNVYLNSLTSITLSGYASYTLNIYGIKF